MTKQPCCPFCRRKAEDIGHWIGSLRLGVIFCADMGECLGAVCEQRDEAEETLTNLRQALSERNERLHAALAAAVHGQWDACRQILEKG